MMPHPFHIHGNHFYVLKVNGVDPPLNLRGRKDVVTVSPNGGSVKLITQYNDFGDSLVPFMFHCHILSHEDNGMMGQFVIKPDLFSGITPTILSAETVLIYPNPIANHVYFSFPGLNENSSISYKIFDSSGHLVNSNYSKNVNSIEVNNLSPGLYFLQIDSGIFHGFARFLRQ
jgi:bilirubin oxidase